MVVAVILGGFSPLTLALTWAF